LKNASIVVSLVNSFIRHQPQHDQDYQLMFLCDSSSCSRKTLLIWKDQ